MTDVLQPMRPKLVQAVETAFSGKMVAYVCSNTIEASNLSSLAQQRMHIKPTSKKNILKVGRGLLHIRTLHQNPRATFDEVIIDQDAIRSAKTEELTAKIDRWRAANMKKSLGTQLLTQYPL